MKTQKAVVLQGDGKASLVTDRPIPKLRPGYVLVDVKAVGLNPTDWKHIDAMNTPGSLLCCEYAGVVAETGHGYEKSWKKGDRICGFVNGANQLESEDGACAEKIVVRADIQLKIPDHMSFEEAATLGVASITCGQGLYQSLKLRYPGKPSTTNEHILIYGGSSAMGAFGVQFAKLSGYTVISTSSPRNFDFVKSLGADVVFDYNDPDCTNKIKQFANNNLKLVWDCISTDETAKICSDALVAGGAYGNLLPVQCPREDVESKFTLGYTCVGEPVVKAFFESLDNTADFEFMKGWIQYLEPLIEQGKLKPHPQTVDTGLEKVLDGVNMLRTNQVSATKLVYVV